MNEQIRMHPAAGVPIPILLLALAPAARAVAADTPWQQPDGGWSRCCSPTSMTTLSASRSVPAAQISASRSTWTRRCRRSSNNPRLSIGHDLDAGTCDVLLDGVVLLDDRAHGVAGSGIGRFIMNFQFGQGPTRALIDNVSVTAMLPDRIFRDGFDGDVPLR